MPSISVIVPVYQAEKLLRPCVESVLRQTFSDWELLLVDDGSTDASPAICRELAAADDRIRFLPQAENRGVSEARNRGLREFRGVCAAFLDADDTLEPRALETLWCLREQSGADTAGCAHLNLLPSGSGAAEKLLPAGVYDRGAIRESIVYPLLGDRLAQPLFNGFIWRYLFDGEILRQNAIAFEGAYLEDELFLIEYFCHAKSLAVTDQPLYRYYWNPHSATHRYMRDFQQVFARFLERKEDLARRYGLTEGRPQWRTATLWAGLLIAIGNEYAKGNEKSFREKTQTVKALCEAPEMAAAIRALHPTGMGRNKQIVAALVEKKRYGLLTALYRVKNRR